MGLPRAGRAANQDIAMLADEVTTGQLQNLLAVDRWVEGKVKGFQRLGTVGGRTTESQRQLLLGPPLNLVFQQAREKLGVGPLAINRLAAACIERLQNARQPQL